MPFPLADNLDGVGKLLDEAKYILVQDLRRSPDAFAVDHGGCACLSCQRKARWLQNYVDLSTKLTAVALALDG